MQLCVCALLGACHFIFDIIALPSLSTLFFFISCWSHSIVSTFHSPIILLAIAHSSSLFVVAAVCSCLLLLVCVVVLVTVFVPAKNVLDDENIHIIHSHKKHARTHLNALLLFSRLSPKKQLLFIHFASVIHF